MITELTKEYISCNGPVYVQIKPDDDIYFIEWYLIDKCGCYYWNSGDPHQCSKYHIGDVIDFCDRYIKISYLHRKKILVLLSAYDYRSKNMSTVVTSREILRVNKLMKIKQRMKYVQK